jgi:hypothetical protein
MWWGCLKWVIGCGLSGIKRHRNNPVKYLMPKPLGYVG